MLLLVVHIWACRSLLSHFAATRCFQHYKYKKKINEKKIKFIRILKNFVLYLYRTIKHINTMKKSILFLQVITIVGMITSMVVMFNAISNETIIEAISCFMFFGGVGVLAIILDERLKKKITN